MSRQIQAFQLITITDNKPVIDIFETRQKARDTLLKQVKEHWEKYNTDPDVKWQNVLDKIKTGEYHSNNFVRADDGGYRTSTFTMTPDGGDSTMTDQHISWYLNHIILIEED